ncbi:type-F conjugative transfer system pilin assembly protein TrbC [Devosia sp.]|uniref:type-F conjugative transfer system pilin assembly protein TrbC n=1 Tax=Devosia sp. TaxID=1871048 RepID=UPI002736AEAC|nr:type-F conjugative transfer system pilin assembly protein TrbC [Devosia sp.]MDP2781064.1 type-F conjugative transfer system pilin assembly protein TrbC [Devosia sp.]
MTKNLARRALLFAALTMLAQQVCADAPVETPLERSNRVLKELNAQFARHRRPDAAKLDSFPQPTVAASPFDLAQHFSKPPFMPINTATHELMVFVSFSMPPESLQRIVEQSERTGAHIVFRGFRGNKMMEMSQHIAKLIGNHRVEVSVNPPAFNQFQVSAVPALVIALPTASEGMDNGCAQATQFVKVTGDVGQDYALDLIERTSPRFASAAQVFNRRITRGIQ